MMPADSRTTPDPEEPSVQRMHRRPEGPRWLRAVALSALVCVGSGGCAVGGVGTLLAHVEPRETVSVLSVYSLGIHLRQRDDDPGAHVGYSRRTYTFAGRMDAAPGWHVMRVPAPTDSAIAQDLLTVGIDLTATAPEAGLTLGYLHTRLLARMPVDGDQVVEYTGAELRIHPLPTCSKDTPCATPLFSR